MSFSSRRAPRMAIILSNAKAMGPKNRCGIYPMALISNWLYKKEGRF